MRGVMPATTLMANGGLGIESGSELIANGSADLVSYGASPSVCVCVCEREREREREFVRERPQLCCCRQRFHHKCLPAHTAIHYIAHTAIMRVYTHTHTHTHLPALLPQAAPSSPMQICPSSWRRATAQASSTPVGAGKFWLCMYIVLYCILYASSHTTLPPIRYLSTLMCEFRRATTQEAS